DFLLRNRAGRSDFILACGGGVTSDLVGYAAATAMRGIRWGIVSTTLLGMVDAAIGGKTGINHRLGKNLIGAFWQPTFVLGDLSFLQTLPRREMVAGLGEILKYAGLAGGQMPAKVDRYLEQDDLYCERLLLPLIRRSVAYKAKVVAEDERETNRRAVLNLGHTFAHAIENAGRYSALLHGEAVIVGLLAAVELSCRTRPRSAKYLEPYRRLITKTMRYLPHRRISIDRVLSAMQFDKKRVGEKMRFVLLTKPGDPHISSEIAARDVEASLESALKVYQSYGGRHAPHTDR
ncbi:MAG: 3-dehydroquinate synthase family protein, partial [Candidatus Zixiibacteriota bacterium]